MLYLRRERREIQWRISEKLQTEYHGISILHPKIKGTGTQPFTASGQPTNLEGALVQCHEM
jgi:hypothetical protein